MEGSTTVNLTGYSSFSGALGVTTATLDSILQDGATCPTIEVNRGVALEVFKHVRGKQEALHLVLGTLNDNCQKSAVKTLHTKVQRMQNNLQKKIKNRAKDMEDWLKSPLSIETSPAPFDEANESSSRKRSLPTEEPTVESKVAKLEDQVSKMRVHHDTDHRNLNKKVTRRDENLDKVKEKLAAAKVKENEQAVEIAWLRGEVEELKKLAEDFKKGKRSIQQRYSKLNIKANKKDQEKEDVITRLHEVIECHERDLAYYEDLTDFLESDDIETFEGGKYVNELRITIMILLAECNVSMSKVMKVINVILKNLTGKKLKRNPSKGVLHRLLIEAQMIGKSHVAECMLSEADLECLAGHVLHSDATSKHHRHYESFQVTLPSGTTMSMGLNETAGGSTEELTEAFLTNIKDLAAAVKSKEENAVARLIASIKHTMSDQGSVNPCFNEALQKIRSEVLETVVENWAELSPNIQTQVHEMTNFFCKMHIVVNFATEADKVLKMFENNVSVGRNPHAFAKSESGAARLVRTACKSFTSRGCDKAGVHHLWDSDVCEKDNENKMVTFKGNRFNILFFDGGAVYYHKDDIREFIGSLADPNTLLESVDFDIQEPAYLAGIRALGIIDKIITGPYWRLLEQEGGIYSINTHLLQMKLTMEAWASDASPLLDEDTFLFDPQVVSINKDDVYRKLLEPASPLIDSLTQLALEVLMTSLLIILERQAKDNLPGGKHWDPSEVQKAAASHVPKTNTCAERDFAMLDMIIKNKPAAGVHVFEVMIMWTNNKTAEWIAGLSEERKNQLIDEARESFTEMKKKIKVRQVQLKKEKLAKLKERQAKKAAGDRKHYNNRMGLTDKITNMGGLWKLDQVDRHVQQLSTEAGKRDALYVQLQFHREVLQAKGKRTLFQKTCQKQDNSSETMSKHLKEVLELNPSTEEINEPAGLAYLPQTEMDDRMAQMKKALEVRLKEGRRKRQADAAKTHLPILLEDPSKLVGQHILHKCAPEGEEVNWFDGKVLRIDKNSTDPLKVIFCIEYKDTPELWYFNLLRDIQKGDIIFL